MTLEHWLMSARTRLEAEYTAHFRETLDATQDAAQAMLGDAEALNGRLKRQYLTVDEGSRS
jgi:hypothetical protein